MDRHLRRLMLKKQKLRIDYNEIQNAIHQYVQIELEGSIDETRESELKEAFIVGHIADTLSANSDIQMLGEPSDKDVLNVLSKKGALSKGNSRDRRTREEERAYGNAREAWSYLF